MNVYKAMKGFPARLFITHNGQVCASDAEGKMVPITAGSVASQIIVHWYNTGPRLLEILKRAERELVCVSDALGTDEESRTAECGRKMAALCRSITKEAEEIIGL